MGRLGGCLAAEVYELGAQEMDYLALLRIAISRAPRGVAAAVRRGHLITVRPVRQCDGERHFATLSGSAGFRGGLSDTIRKCVRRLCPPRTR